MLELYPRVLRQSGYYDDKIEADHDGSALTRAEVVDEIDAGNPVVAGITPGSFGAFQGGAAHVALIVGYLDDGDTLLVNDPYPYSGFDPYLSAGAVAVNHLQYEIDYSDFRSNLNWSESWTVSRSDGGDGGNATYCCTPAGKLGPYPPGIPVGQACYGTHPVTGMSYGQACY